MAFASLPLYERDKLRLNPEMTARSAQALEFRPVNW
jgi:hypothetical protein